MDFPEALQTLAEISIAFAGFSGLVVALRKNPGPLTDVQKYRLRVLLTLAFGAMFLSFLPELLYDYTAHAGRVWAWASTAAALFSLLFVTWWLKPSRRIMKVAPEIFDWFAVSRMAAGHATIIVLLLANVFSLLPEHAAAPYVTALIWYLMHAAQQFSRMLFIQPRRDD